MRKASPAQANGGSRIIRNTFYASLFVYIVSNMAATVGSLVDGILIGQFMGLDSIAAFGLASPIAMVYVLFGAVIATGARQRFTRRIGCGDLDGAKGIFTLSVLLSVGLAVFLMIVILVFASQISVMLGAAGNAAYLFEKTRNYLIGVAVGLPAMNAMRILNAYMAIDNDRNMPIISSVVLTAADILLDLLVIFVLHGDTLEMGLATSVSYYIAVAVMLLHFRRKERLMVFSFSSIRLKESGAMLMSGLQNGFSRIAITVRSVFMNNLLAGVAVSAAGCIAAYSVHRQMDSFLNCIVFGMADTCAMIVDMLLAEENRPMIRRLLKTSFRASLTLVVVIAAVVFLLAPFLASLFIKDNPEVLSLSTWAIRCYALGMPLSGLNVVYHYYLNSLGKHKAAMVFALLRDGLFLMFSAWALLPFAGAHAAWIAFPVTQVLLLIAEAAYAAFVCRKNQIRVKDLWDRILLLPNGFDVPENDRIDRTITSHDEVIALSAEAWSFCHDRGCDTSRTYAISLAVEEMATNTVVEGFRPGKHNSIDMRILKKGDDYIVRIRDDCLIFDPVKQLQLYSDKVPMHHIGLRMAIGSAKDVQYTCVLKLNNLVIRV